MRRVRIGLTVVLCGVLALALTPPAAGQEDEEDRTLRVALNAFENNITPFTLTMQGLPVTHDLVNLVYDTLFWSQVKEEPEPWLAESAEPNDDYTEWTVTLRDGVTWHDGEPLTAEDVAFSFDLYNDSPPNRYSHHVFAIPPYTGAEVVDDTTVVLRYDAPAPTFTIMPGADVPIVPKHIWEDVETPEEFTEELPVGSGPFEVTELVPDQRYTLEANTDYFKGEPTVDRLELPIIPQPSSAFAALQAGQVDAVDVTAPPELVEQMEADENIEVLEGTRFESTHLHFNATKEPLSDPELRRAIALAIDSQAIVDTVLLGQGQPGRDGFTHPDVHWADPDGQSTHDPEQAAQLLDEAGYEEGEDGTRVGPDGQPLQFSVLVASVQPLHLRAAQIAAQQVAEVGVQLDVESIEPATLGQRRGAAQYDAFVTNLESHGHADPDALYFFFGAGIPAPVFGGYDNEEFNELAIEASQTTDFDDGVELRHELQQMFAEAAPAVVLYYPDGNYAYRPEAYDGWISDPGHGNFTKRSFLPEYANVSDQAADDASADDDAADDADDEDAAAAPTDAEQPWGLVALIVVALIVVGVIVAVVRGRSAKT